MPFSEAIELDLKKQVYLGGNTDHLAALLISNRLTFDWNNCARKHGLFNDHSPLGRSG